MILYVGEVTSIQSFTKCLIRNLAKVVFPTPRGPERVITSPSEQLFDIFFAKSFSSLRL